MKARVPIYYEHFKRLGEQIERIKREHDIPGFDTSDFQPMPDWKPCASHEEKRPDYDLYGIYYRIPFHTFTSTYNNPLLDEVSKTDPYVYGIAMNTETARKKGIKNGDWVVIQSAGTGHEIEGRAALSEAIHPELIAYASGGGHWSKGLPIASRQGKGICPEWLIPLSWDYVDTVSLDLDLCVKVKVQRKGDERLDDLRHGNRPEKMHWLSRLRDICMSANATGPGVLWSRVLFCELVESCSRGVPVPVLCMHCRVPACVDVCPTGASTKRSDGIVAIDERACSGYVNCPMACPYGARHVSPAKDESRFPGKGLTPSETIGSGGSTPRVRWEMQFCLPRIEQGLEPACVQIACPRRDILAISMTLRAKCRQLIRRGSSFRFVP